MVGYVPLVSSIPSGSYNFSPNLFCGVPDLQQKGLNKDLQFWVSLTLSLSLPTIWLWVSASVHISCWRRNMSNDNWTSHCSISSAEYH